MLILRLCRIIVVRSVIMLCHRLRSVIVARLFVMLILRLCRIIVVRSVIMLYLSLCCIRAFGVRNISLKIGIGIYIRGIRNRLLRRKIHLAGKSSKRRESTARFLYRLLCGNDGKSSLRDTSTAIERNRRITGICRGRVYTQHLRRCRVSYNEGCTG